MIVEPIFSVSLGGTPLPIIPHCWAKLPDNLKSNGNVESCFNSSIVGFLFLPSATKNIDGVLVMV